MTGDFLDCRDSQEPPPPQGLLLGGMEEPANKDEANTSAPHAVGNGEPNGPLVEALQHNGVGADAVNGAVAMEVDGGAKPATSQDEFGEGEAGDDAVNGVPEVELEEADAIEAYNDVRQEQMRQIEEAKAKAVSWAVCDWHLAAPRSGVMMPRVHHMCVLSQLQHVGSAC